MLEVDLSSAFYAARAVLPNMERARHGRIVFIGSSAVYDGAGGNAANRASQRHEPEIHYLRLTWGPWLDAV